MKIKLNISITLLAVFALLLITTVASAASKGTSKAEIEKTQHVLKEKGLYKGNITGKLDAPTKDAVKDFQRKQGLNPTGYLNKDTKVALGLERASSTGRTSRSRSRAGREPGVKYPHVRRSHRR